MLARCAAVGLTTLALLTSAASASLLTTASRSSLPKACPATAIVSSALKFTLEKKVLSYSSITYGPTTPAGPNPARATQKTCDYRFPPLEAAKGIIVPVTITFEYPVSKGIFDAARHAASHSVLTITVPNLGDDAWVVRAPLADPRAGNSLFVLRGNDEVVVGAPPNASVGMLVALVRKLV